MINLLLCTLLDIRLVIVLQSEDSGVVLEVHAEVELHSTEDGLVPYQQEPVALDISHSMVLHIVTTEKLVVIV
jgi:hypothetical protein